MTAPTFFSVTPRRLSEIAAATQSELRGGDGSDPVVDTAGPIEAAGAGAISFIDNPKYLQHAANSAASGVFVQEKYLDRMPAGLPLLVNRQPYRAYAIALGMIFESAQRPQPITGETGISAHAHIMASAKIENSVIIEAGAIIGAGAAIGRGTHVLANAVIGAGVQIGRNCTIGIGVSITHALVGDNVILHPGVRIGQDGFGFAMGAGGHLKVPQIGRVIIQDNVEIGANSTVDRGANRDTVIGEGTKIDNLVQIGHNVVIGRHCVIVGLAGVAGSATLGDYVVIAGQVGIVGHIKIGNGAQVGGGSGVNKDVAPGERVMGTPALPIREWARLTNWQNAIARGEKKSGRGEDDGNS